MVTVQRPVSAAEREAERLQARTTLVEQFNSTGSLARALLHGPITVLDLVPASAAALHLEGVTSTVGDAPEVARIEQVVEYLRAERCRLPIASDSLATDHPQLAKLLPAVAGLLIVPIDGARGCLAWFRPEVEVAERHDDRSESARARGASPSTRSRDVAGRAEPWEGLDEAAAQFSRDLDGAILRNLHSDLAHFGFHDALTGLSNRRLLMDRIEHALAGPTRGSGVALLFIDINSFNAINGSLGHDSGDQVLIQAAERLRSVTRDSDTVARLAGDEFVILAGSADRVAASRIAERVLSALERSFTLSGNPVKVTASIGVAEAEAENTAADLLRRAHAALDWAKGFGRTDQTTDGLPQPPSKVAFLTGERIEIVR
jgi:diguanylate cyclase (GGDEF)-like protein